MTTDFDAVVVGAGFGGLSMLQNLRQLDMSVKVFERGDGVGGTWYWNRYPGARCDSESVYYMFSDHFSPQILDEWTWSERFAAQPEILDYLNFVTDKMDLRRDIQFGTAVTGAVYDEANNRWEITTDDGGTTTARYLVTAVGCISTTNLPAFPGLADYAGERYHTGAWPHEPVDFGGKRVAVIGTGATGVQAIPEIGGAPRRLPTHARLRHPGPQRPLDTEYVQEVKAHYPELWEKVRASGFGLPYRLVDHVPVGWLCTATYNAVHDADERERGAGDPARGARSGRAR